jgi:hypothetical protein
MLWRVGWFQLDLIFIELERKAAQSFLKLTHNKKSGFLLAFVFFLKGLYMAQKEGLEFNSNA